MGSKCGSSDTFGEIDVQFSEDGEIDVQFSEDGEIDVQLSEDGEIDVQFSEDGEIDVQFSEDGEIVLQKLKKNCRKNPGHQNFIPANQFNIKDLPMKYQDPDIYDLIKVTSDLTVRVSCKYVSQLRPLCLPGSTAPYSLSDKRGTATVTSGTGRVWQIVEEHGTCEDPFDQMYTDELKYREQSASDGNGNMTNKPDCDSKGNSEDDSSKYKSRFETCPCETCKTSKTPSKQFSWIKILTARHVVFNNKEAENATCRLFFDSDSSTKVILTVVEMVTLDPEMDWCWLRCVTCDLNLISKLSDLVNQHFELWTKVNTKFSKSRENNRLTVIVSHPHGCSKQVSIGNWTEVQVVNKIWTKYYYTAATCPGSSGASVVMLGYTGTDDHVHSGGKVTMVVSDETDGTNSGGGHINCNFSAAGDDYWMIT